MKKIFAIIAIVALAMVSFSCRSEKQECVAEDEEVVAVDSTNVEVVEADSLYTVE